MAYTVSASASTPVKVFAIAALVAELLVSILWPIWFMGFLVGIQAFAVWEAFRQIRITLPTHK
jgi:hypothetical protein